ncbi:hypothetical protein IFM58399_00778 [Aspergillus lentulus]|uniref:uncharacterized protein n=1 Tax=Aspergillus lentulus TaxID=293939 RepID=UPI0013930A22|nr:uncharacterized protein IFM58399_00778 [Aspergillus lentulus]GFF24780.1 hypothetical protein IFM58399_00778 [Aspergillus lentulus]
MPIYDITHYLPIETLPHPETDKTNYTKPILVLIVSLRVNTWNTYLFLIRKLQREAQPHLRHKRSLQRQVDHRWAIAAAGSDGTTATYSGDVSGEELPPVVSYEGPWIETPDTVVGDWDEVQSEGEVAGDEEGYLGDSAEMDEDDGDDEDEEGDEEDEELRGDCPVAIHELNPRTTPKQRSWEEARLEATSPLSVIWRTAARWPR